MFVSAHLQLLSLIDKGREYLSGKAGIQTVSSSLDFPLISMTLKAARCRENSN